MASRKTRTVAALLLAVSFLFTACSDSETAEADDGAGGMAGGGASCTTTFDLTGTWVSAYECTGSAGNFMGQDTLMVTQTGTNVTFSNQDGDDFTGTLCGNTMTYTGGGTNYTESGTWTIDDADNFTKTADFTRNDGSGGGTCPGTGDRQ